MQNVRCHHMATLGCYGVSNKRLLMFALLQVTLYGLDFLTQCEEFEIHINENSVVHELPTS